MTLVILCLLIVVVLILARLMASWRQTSLHTATCAALARQADELARNLHPQMLQNLTFSAADRGTVWFERLREQLMGYGQLVAGLKIYGVALRGDAWAFGPCTCSDHAGPESTSPVGHAGIPMRSAARSCFEKKTIQVVGPDPQNGYPHFSAFAPVIDPRSGSVIMAVGLDLPAAQWQRAVRQAQTLPNSVALVMIVVVLGAALLIGRRDHLPEHFRPWLRHVETGLVGIFGLLFTALLVLWMIENEKDQRVQIFDNVCEYRIEEIRDALTHVRKDIATIARFFEESNWVESKEFATFVEPLIETELVHGYLWIPRVEATDKAALETRARLDGMRDFFIWEKDAQGSRLSVSQRSVYYPIQYAVAGLGQPFRVGFDLGSEPTNRAFLEKSGTTGLSQAYLPVTLGDQTPRQPGMVIYQPVYATDGAAGVSSGSRGRQKLVGFVAAVLDFDAYFKDIFGHHQNGSAMVAIELISMQNATQPTRLAACPETGPFLFGPHNPFHSIELNNLSHLRPLFVAGDVLVIVANPTPAFYSANPIRGAWLVGLIGTVLTVCLTLFVGFFRNHQTFLESQVRQRTAALQESQERLALSLHGADLGVWDWIVPTGHLTVNERWAGMLGYDLREIDPHIRVWEKLVHPEDLPVALASIRSHLENRLEVYECEYRIQHRQGHWVWVLDRGKVMRRGVAGEPLRMLGTHLDITERKQTEEELRQSQAKISSIFRAAPIGIGLVSRRVLQETNDRLCLMTGYTRQELLGKSARMLYFSDEEYEWVGDEKYRQIAESGTGSVETRWCRKDGQAVHIILSSTPIDPSDLMLGVTFTAFDITDRKRHEEEQRILEQQIQQTQKLESLGVMAGGIAHDFNNILMAVLGHAELAIDEVAAWSTARQHLREITVAARRAAELCHQMLAYSGKGAFSLEQTHVSELIDEMVHLLKTSISKKAILNLHLTSGLPPIMADPSQIRQIVLNLILNASEAIGDKSGVITVTAGATRCDQEYLNKTELKDTLSPGLYVYLEVADTGCGMDKATRLRIFEPFYTTKFTGRGLGLAAVMGIVRAHKGALKVYSEPNKGTTFKILLPALDKPHPAERPNEGTKAVQWSGQGTILLADDEETLRALGSRMLERLGFSVLLAENGLEAVELYRLYQERIDLVLLDLTMPHLDGGQAFSELRKLDPEVRVVLTSGYSAEDVSARFAGKGLVGVLQKPFTKANLTELLSKLIP